jgi:hypothetical protein
MYITKKRAITTDTIANPGSGAFLTPGSGMSKKSDPDPE